MNEDVYFVSEVRDGARFFVTVAGRSYCDGTYHIRRIPSAVCTLEYIEKGSGTVLFRGRASHPTKGDVYLLPPNIDHDYYSDEADPWTKVWVNVGGTLAETLIKQYGVGEQTVFHGTQTKELFDRIVTLCASDAPREEKERETAVLFHAILSRLAPSDESEKERLDGVSEDALTMKRLLDRHLSDAVNIEELAKSVFKSRSQAHRVFKAAFGVSPYDYLLSRRMSAAAALLSDTELSVKEIAVRVGFSDEHYFASVFHKRCGMTPTACRKSGRSR